MKLIWCSGCNQWIAIETLVKCQVPYTDPISKDSYYSFECPSDHTELIREYRGR